MTMQAMLLPVLRSRAHLRASVLDAISAAARGAEGLVPAHTVALREPNWPPRVIQIGNAYHNQLETPLLFYVLVLLAMVTRPPTSSCSS